METVISAHIAHNLLHRADISMGQIMKGSHSPGNRTPEINALPLKLSSPELFDNWLLSRQKKKK